MERAVRHNSKTGNGPSSKVRRNKPSVVRTANDTSATDIILARIAKERLALLYTAGKEFGYGREYAKILVDNFFDQLKHHDYGRARRLYVQRRDRIVEHGEIPVIEAEAAFDEMREIVRRFKPRMRRALAKEIRLLER